MPRRAFIQTFGCQMNEHDSFRMAEILAQQGYELTEEPSEASLVLVNTCSVRENPENKVYSLVGRLRALKRKKPDLIIGIGGCVAQQAGEDLLRRDKCIDMVFGPDHYFELPDMLDAVKRGERVLRTKWTDRPPDRIHNFVPEEWLEKGHVDGCKAYIAITKGCDNFCTFCIVPFTRGREVSREPGNIVREANDLVQKGAKEIWLLGQNVNSYQAGDCGFYELLDAISRVDGLKRLRFTSPHPNDWNNALSDLLTERSTICNQIHLPFQAGANRILDMMNRRHTIEEYLDKVRYLRSINPVVEISTDLIVGFPSETEADFEWTLRVLEEVRFGLVYSFKYSPRPGTRAAKRFEDDVPREVKEERLRRVIETQERLDRGMKDGLVGTTHEVLVDGAHPKERGVMNGRTGGYRPVAVRNGHLEVGDMTQVRITGWRNNWLEGETFAPAEARQE